MHKSAGIIIRDKSLLVLRSKGKDTFFAPGGKLAQGETPEAALCRELMEEINIHVDSSDISFFDRYSAPASGNENILLEMDVYYVNSYQGDIKANSEIDEIAWVNSSNVCSLSISSIFREKVFPQLKANGLVN